MKPPKDKGHLKFTDFIEFFPSLKISVSQSLFPKGDLENFLKFQESQGPTLNLRTV